MPTKPFNLQSPEQIAKDYGGNKQKIAQAASMGMVDPTAAVLAGMFIDRMRSAAMQEQQPQGTVAQQVFAPQQQMPQQPQPGAPMQPPPPSAPMGAPPGMAMGGLMGLPVPDDMFEEPTVDAENFAGGGLVAFAAGGEAEDDYDFGDMMRQMFTPTAAEQKASYTALRDAGRVKKERDRPRSEAKKGRDAPPVGDSSVFLPPGLMAQGSFDTPRAFPGQGAAPTITAPAPEYGAGDMLRQMFTPDAKDQKFAYDSLRAAGRDSKPPAKPERGAPAKRDAPPIGDSSAFLPPSLMAQGSFDTPRVFPGPGAPASPRAYKPSTSGKPEGYVPFGGEGTAISGFVGGIRDAARTDEAYAAALAEYRRADLAYRQTAYYNARVRAVGGGAPQPLPPKPVMPKRSDFKAAPKAKPAASAAKPPAGVLDLSGGQSRESVPRGALYRDPQGNIRRNDNGDKGNPIVTPAPSRPAAPAGPRVGGPAPAGPRPAAGPRVGGPAPAGPRPAAGPALSASPAAAPGAGGPPPPTGAAAVLAELEALAPQDRTMRDAMAKRYAEMSSPEALAAQKKQDFWGSLAQIGFGMAGSNSPYFLQAAGQAASAALPGMQQAAHARKAQEMAGLQGQLGIENLTNQERQTLAARAAELSEMRRKGQIDEQQFNAQMALKREELAVDREYKRGMVAAAGARGSGGGRAQATGAKPLTRAQALALVAQERGSHKMTTEQKLARADALVAASSGGAAPTTAPDYTYVNGKLVPTNR